MIAIKGMEMPESCEECRFQGIEVEGGCALSKLFSIRRRWQKKPVWCPLVEIADTHTNPEDSIREGRP